MLRFGLASGFVPDSVSIRPENELSIHFTKDLRKPDPPKREKVTAATAVHVEAVGPNYHGLIAQLASETVLGTTEAQIDRAMEGPDALALVAFVDNRPVGFKTGWGRDAGRFYYHSHMGGVLPEFRGMGVATALARHQIRAIAGMGYRKVGYFTKHDNVAMLRMALGLGFEIVGLQFRTQEQFAQVMLERDVTPADRE
jgi:ribosomal protein S18 acetylase RimI-like enzyme